MSTSFFIGQVPVRFFELRGWDGKEKETEAPPLVGMASADFCKAALNGTWSSSSSLPSLFLKCACNSSRLAGLEFEAAL
jgi:hypothetical protein